LNLVSESKALTNADLPNSLGRQNTQSSYGFLQQFSMRNVFEFMISCSLLVQVGGTVLSAKLAKDKGWAINLGGGFHHCCSNEGGGFCAYADITLTIQFAFERLGISRVMIIDLDAHQGNGHEHDFMNNKSIYILDMYNSDIYPRARLSSPFLDMYEKQIIQIQFSVHFFLSQSVCKQAQYCGNEMRNGGNGAKSSDIL
jgi:hypothetical protein